MAAATGPHSIDETIELDQRADIDGHPDAIVGGITPTENTADAVAQIDRQMNASRFRGVRPMGAFQSPLPSIEVLRALEERDLVFELMAHPDQLEAAARGLADLDDLVIVVEHAGWPRSADDDERTLWAAGLAALADLGDNVVCKLSGLAMPLGSMDATVQRPWLEQAMETFGLDRCMFASNFPVDGLHGSLDDLFTTYATVTAGLDEASLDKLFAGNAERTYGL